MVESACARTGKSGVRNTTVMWTRTRGSRRREACRRQRPMPRRQQSRPRKQSRKWVASTSAWTKWTTGTGLPIENTVRVPPFAARPYLLFFGLHSRRVACDLPLWLPLWLWLLARHGGAFGQDYNPCKYRASDDGGALGEPVIIFVKAHVFSTTMSGEECLGGSSKECQKIACTQQATSDCRTKAYWCNSGRVCVKGRSAAPKEFCVGDGS